MTPQTSINSGWSPGLWLFNVQLMRNKLSRKIQKKNIEKITCTNISWYKSIIEWKNELFIFDTNNQNSKQRLQRNFFITICIVVKPSNVICYIVAKLINEYHITFVIKWNYLYLKKYFCLFFYIGALW